MQQVNRGYNQKNIFIYLAFISLAVISSYGAILSFDVPFPAILVFVVFLFLFCVCTGISNLRFGTISFLLLLRLVLFTVNGAFLALDPILLSEQILITVISIAVYECIRALPSENEKIIKNVLIIFSLITSIQLILGFLFHIFVDKNDVTAGIGQSNYAASFLVLSIAYLMFRKNKWYEKLVVLVDIAALVLTMSFGAYMAFGIVLVYYVIKTFNWKHTKSWIYLLIFVLLGIVAFYCFFNTGTGREIYGKIEQKISFLLAGDWKNLGSSRTELYGFSWHNIKKHILFGTVDNYDIMMGEEYRFQNFRTHNFVLESLLLYGIIGSILNLLILIIVFRKAFKKKLTEPMLACFVAFIAILIHGFIEPNFFTMHFEPFVWLILGGLMSRPTILQTQLHGR